MNQEEMMYREYDNYWIYGNRRHEPEFYFQKTNNFSHLAHTDRYKQVQGKGSYNNAYDYVRHPNTVTTSHQNLPNNRPRVTSTMSLLPSPTCLPSYPSSLTHQYLPNEVCSAQPKSVPDSCVPLQNQVLRNVQNYNPGQTANYKSSTGHVNNQESCNYKTQMSSIRVKDFSLLNNNSTNNNCNSLLVSSAHQSQQKKPWYYLQDSPENRQNGISNGQMQRDNRNHDNIAIVEVNYPYQNYGSVPSHNHHVSNEEQYSQHSAALYQHSAQYERQICHDGLHQGSVKSNNSSNYPPAQRNPSRIGSQEADGQRRLDSGKHSDNNAYAFNMSESNKVNPASQAQLARPEGTQNALQSPSVSTSRIDLTAKSQPQNSNKEVTSFMVTVPDAPRTTSRDDSAEARRSSDFSSTTSTLANITLKDCAGDRVSNQKEGFDISAGSRVPQLDQQEPGCGSKEENQNRQKETVVVCITERTLGCEIIPKVENLEGLEEDSLGDEKADVRDEAQVQAIKSETNSSVENKNTDNIEQASDSQESELPKTESTENIEPLILENSENQPDSIRTTSKESQQPDVVILDDTGTSAEHREDWDEIDHLGGGDKCRSEINRDKLDLLIEFLRGDEEPFEVLTIGEDDSPPPVTSPGEEIHPKKNRRKLNKASIVRNRNTEREMISLVSYKTPKHSSVKSSLTEQTQTASAEGSDCSKDTDFGETVSEDKQPEKGPGDEEPKDSITPEEEKEVDDRSPGELTCDCCCYGKGITREERTIINIMRAFQNLKRHFCASCAFTSPVESIWINIVSGELRCLNCFKKMISRSEENHGSSPKKLKAAVAGNNEEGNGKESEEGKNLEKKPKWIARSEENHGSSPKKLKAAVAGNNEEGDGKEREEGKNMEKKSKCEGQTPAKEAYGREDLKDRVEEKNGMRFENSGDLKKDGSGTVDKRKRETRSDEVEKPKRRRSTEEAFFGALRPNEKHGKKGGEEDCSDGSGKKSNSAEDTAFRKKAVTKEDEGDSRHKRRDKHSAKNHEKSRKRGRAELKDPSYLPPRKVPAEEKKPRKTCRISEEVESNSAKVQKKRREHCTSKDGEKKKHPCQSAGTISQKKPAGKHYKSSKQCLISKLFKGKRCLKVDPGHKDLNKEVHRREPQREEERRRADCHSQPRSMSVHRTMEKRRHSGEVPTEGRESHHRTGKNGEEGTTRSSKEDKRDKAVVDILEGIVKGTGEKCSDRESMLIIRLMKTTTKLSMRLLGET